MALVSEYDHVCICTSYSHDRLATRPCPKMHVNVKFLSSVFYCGLWVLCLVGWSFNTQKLKLKLPRISPWPCWSAYKAVKQKFGGKISPNVNINANCVGRMSGVCLISQTLWCGLTGSFDCKRTWHENTSNTHVNPPQVKVKNWEPCIHLAVKKPNKPKYCTFTEKYKKKNLRVDQCGSFIYSLVTCLQAFSLSFLNILKKKSQYLLSLIHDCII